MLDPGFACLPFKPILNLAEPVTQAPAALMTKCCLSEVPGPPTVGLLPLMGWMVLSNLPKDARRMHLASTEATQNTIRPPLLEAVRSVSHIPV